MSGNNLVRVTIFTVIIITELVCHVNLAAQEADYFLGRGKYSFIAYEKNAIILAEDDSRFGNFYQKFDSLVAYGKGKIQIVHMGGSHIQADIYTHVIRKRMQELSPDMNGGRGMIFPVKMTNSNNPRNFGVNYTGRWDYCRSIDPNLPCPIGITGMAVKTTDSKASITLIPNRDSNIYYTYNQVRIFHERTQYHVYVDSDNQLINGNYDSLSGCTVFNSQYFGDTLKIFLSSDNSNDTFILQGVSLDSDSPGLVYNAFGVNGAMLSSYLRCDLYSKHLHALNPDLIIFSIGTNDAYTRKFDTEKFKSEYKRLIKLTQETSPEAAILLTVPNDSYLYRRYINSNTAIMREVIFELAKEYQCAVWDFYAIMGGLNSCQAWRSVDLMQSDKVHFTYSGYELKGELFFSAFLKGWENQLSGFESLTGINSYEKKILQEVTSLE
jgi:lysophospholipase L1-like esterase